MLMKFRQGIYKHDGSKLFLSLTSNGVNINIDNSPVIVNFAHGNSNYLFVEDENVTSAWNGLPHKITSWLYWDIDLITGKRTFGHTVVDPFMDRGHGDELPPNPIKGQHFFLIPKNTMKYYSGHSWKSVVRVFAGVVWNNGRLEGFKTGSQIKRHIKCNSGYLLFNTDGTPIKKSGILSSSEFITTESTFSPQDDRGNEYKVANIEIDGTSVESIGKFHCVNFKGPKKYGIASRLNPEQPCVGITVSEFHKEKLGKVVNYGPIKNKSSWDFKSPRGTSVWVGDCGEVTDTVPQLISMQNIGYVLDSSTIFVDIKSLVKLIDYDQDCFIPSPTPTSTPTVTPTQTPVTTATVTPTPTLAPTPTMSGMG